MIEIKKDITKNVMSNIKAMVAKSLFVGIPSSETRSDNASISNSQIAFINEFGSDHKNIPARPFLRPAIAQSKENIIKILKDGSLKALQGEDMHITLEKAGLYASTQVKNFIVAGSGFTPLKPQTIKARQNRRSHTTAGTKPLIDTGQMLNSITYAIRDK